MVPKLRLAFCLTAVLALVGCDQVTKRVATGELSGRRPLTLVANVLDLQYAENHDTAFSLTRGLEVPAKQYALAVLALFGCALAAGIALRRRGLASRWELTGFALVVAGGLGNAIDRLLHGHVVDFIHLHHWPIFNVADILVVAGAISLALGMRRPTAPAPG